MRKLQTCWLIGAVLVLGAACTRPASMQGFAGATMGQLLSVPMVLLGLGLILWARPLPPEQRAAAAPEEKPAPRAKGAAKARTKGKSGRR